MTFRLILNADDFGYDPAVSRGIERSMREGCVSSTTFIVNSPHSAEAASATSGLAVGLHLNLVRFQSVSDPSRELNEVTTLTRDFVVAETSAQVALFQKLLGRRPTHLDVHKHAHRAAAVLEGLTEVALRHALPVRSIDPAMRERLRAHGVRTNDVFLGDAGADAYWTLDQWSRQLDAAPREGVVELMCHPGLRPSHVTSGYGAQREIELATFVDPRAREALRVRGLTLTSWANV